MVRWILRKTTFEFEYYQHTGYKLTQRVPLGKQYVVNNKQYCLLNWTVILFDAYLRVNEPHRAQLLCFNLL